MAQYFYQSLDENNNEIRLITLLPAADRDSEVICDINIVRLAEDDIPQYEALSYTWGSAESPVRLRVSPDSDHNIDITKNLAEALPYLRDTAAPRILWIDAIAINQKDLGERGQQVQRMADIFSLAERVIVWLGMDDANSKTVMEICEFLVTKVEFDDEKGGLRSLSDQPNDVHWGDERERLPYDIETWQTITDFLRRPWFHRLWIWQEIRLAKPNAMIMCGTDSMHWTQLRPLLGCIVCKESSIPSEIRGFEDAWKSVLNGYFLANLTSSTSRRLLMMMQHARCVDPRDRVYGILGLFSRMNMPIDLQPDYEKPVVDVYMDLMMHFTQKSENLDLLRLCQYRETMASWPSWIPDLTDFEVGCEIESRASGSSTCEVALLQDRGLRATGRRLCQIVSVDSSDVPYGHCNPKIRRWARGIDMTSSYVDGRPMAEAFCLSICAGAVSDLYVPPHATAPNLQSTLAFLQDILRLEDNEVVKYQDEDVVSKQVSFACARRAFFTTSSNHFGIGPLGAREGDHICVLLGCDVPMVVRADSNGRYKIIGQGYVSGIGNNEAFLGPLPSGFKEVSRYDAEFKVQDRVFVHQETGKFQIEDPRLGTELPSGWCRGPDVQGLYRGYFSHHSEPDTWMDCDPRLTKSELLKRGVPLEDIEFS